MKSPILRYLLVVVYIHVTSFFASTQSVTEIVTDFNGYWRSGIRPNVNPVAPNNSHNLVAFTWKGVRYSTGVNNALLTTNSLTYTAGSYKALPISSFSMVPSSGTYVGFGQLYDGVATGGSTPAPPNNIPFYLTDGINGLNLGTAIYNLPAGNMIYDVGVFDIARIGDGIPDIIITQMGEINTTAIDTFKFVNPSGVTVGNPIALTFAGADTLGICDNDFYGASTNPMTFTSSFYPNNTKRAIRLYAFEISDFGLTAGDFATIDKFIHRTSGQSDPAFVAYNTLAIQLLPNNNPGCFTTLPGLWLKGNDGTSTITNNQKLTLWQDRSPNTLTLEQNNTTYQPQFKDATNAFNYNAYINFDNTNRLLSPNSPFADTASNADIFIVGRPTNTTAATKHKIIGFSRRATDNTGTNAGDYPAISYLPNGQVTIDSGNTRLATSTATGSNTIFLQQIHYTQGGSRSIQFFKNGTADGSANTSRSFGRWTFQLGDITTGRQSDLDIAEVIIFPQNLVADDRIKIASYLAVKYGLTLSHNYVAGNNNIIWNRTNNAGYNNTVFGIGREDCQGIHRKQSKSVEADALITIGNVAISADNITNFNLMTNNTYSMMGDNGASLSLQTTEVPAGCYQRVGREWKVQETGNVGNIAMRVPAASSASTIKLPAAINNVMYLLVDNDGDFSNGIINIVPMTLNGTNWEVSYNFANGNFFTFATDNGAVVRDRNDLPTPWPAASAVVNGCDTNGDALISLSDMNGLRPMVWAGNAVTTEATANTNSTATGDNADDGLVIPAILSRQTPNTFTILLNGTIANSTAHYRLWIDWNGDGNFGNDVDGNGNPATYAGSAIINGTTPTSVNISALAPNQALTNYAIRLIVSNSAIANNYITNPAFVYNIANGEVEDYFTAAIILPLKLENFSYTEAACKIRLKWRTSWEKETKEFIVEGSNNGTNFSAVTTIPSKNQEAGASYEYTIPATTQYKYYRLKMKDIDAEFTYSQVVHVNTSCETSGLQITPNPASSQTVITSSKTIKKIELLTTAGQVVETYILQQRQSATYTLSLRNLAKGIYIVKVTGMDETVSHIKLIKE